MLHQKTVAIKNWIKAMGFELVKSHLLRNSLINYYNLGNFGIYEEIKTSEGSEKPDENQSKFISWTPWGVEIKVNSVKDLSAAYQESINFNPELVLN